MKIENITLLIPLHPPKYHFIYSLLNRFDNNNIEIDIHLVFSNRADYDMFSMKDKIHPIFSEPNQTKSIITYKKFFGLKYLADSKYDYIICCDGEIDIIPSNFTNEIINSKIKQIFDNKKIYAGNANGSLAPSIMNTSANLFPEKYEYLKDITQNFKLYFWWSDLPVYRRVDLHPFFNMINYDNIVWEHFDHIIYQYYLILCDNFEIIDTTPITHKTWSLEGLDTDNMDILNSLLSIHYGFSWNTNKFYNINKTFIESQQGFLIYHLDRF
jgi:hypothetical protein